MAGLEGQILINKSLNFVREHGIDELKSQLVDLQQSNHSWSSHRNGQEKKVNEILKEAASTTTMEDVEKLHRIGPPKQRKLDIIVRFKSHTVKENFLWEKTWHKY